VIILFLSPLFSPLLYAQKNNERARIFVDASSNNFPPMTMPQMTGDKLAKEILKIRPDMPIILCTGFSEKIDDEKARTLGIRRYIEKLLNMSDFVVTVRKVLDS